MENLSKKRVAILATYGFEESELREPKRALEKAGFQVDIISEIQGTIKSWTFGHWGKAYYVDQTLGHVTQDNYSALLLPGGVMSADNLRRNKTAISFVRSFFDHKKPLAAICYGISLLVEADVLRGFNVTLYNSLTKDKENTGAFWLDEEVVDDERLITSRNAEDFSSFNEKFIEKIYKFNYAEQIT